MMVCITSMLKQKNLNSFTNYKVLFICSVMNWPFLFYFYTIKALISTGGWKHVLFTFEKRFLKCFLKLAVLVLSAGVTNWRYTILNHSRCFYFFVFSRHFLSKWILKPKYEWWSRISMGVKHDSNSVKLHIII